MPTDERILFHITEGALRRFSLWNEPSLPEFAVGEDEKYRLFQEAKTAQAGNAPHPLHTLENWPYWLVLDLCRYLWDIPDPALMLEIDNLKEAVADFCDQQYSEHELQSSSQLLND